MKIKCKLCKKEFEKKKYNQVYCSNNCRKEKYADDYWERRKMDKCEICGFKYFTEKHHIIKKLGWGADTEDNCVYLCKNHHAMADSIYFYEMMKKLIFNKTGKVGKRLSYEEIKFLKEEIKDEIREKHENPQEDYFEENSWLFYQTMLQMIRFQDFYPRLKWMNKNTIADNKEFCKENI